jgi:hypothetical protein
VDVSFQAILFVFCGVMASLATSEPYYSYPSYVYNHPQHYAPSYSTFSYPGVPYIQAPTYQLPKQDIGVSYGPIRYKVKEDG